MKNSRHVQQYSVFHDSQENYLKDWHKPYAEIFSGLPRVLDFGCGPQYFADLLVPTGTEVLGIDSDPMMVELSKKRGHNAILGDQNALTHLTEGYDGIHISHVVEHLGGDELVLLLREAHRILRPGGLIVIRTPNWKNKLVREHLFWMDHTHVRPYPAALLERLLADTGFEVSDSGEEPFNVADVFVVGRRIPVPETSAPKVRFTRRDSKGLVQRILQKAKRLIQTFRDI